MILMDARRVEAHFEMFALRSFPSVLDFQRLGQPLRYSRPTLLLRANGGYFVCPRNFPINQTVTTGFQLPTSARAVVAGEIRTQGGYL
jgi:hypothetical protein